MITQDTLRPVMLDLKEATQAHHDATEAGAFNDDLVKGRLPLDKYIDSLAQLYLIHRTLEARLSRLQSEMPVFSAVLRSYQFQEPYLAMDLVYFGRNLAAIDSLSATDTFISHLDRMAEDCPVALLGVHYVLEGSKNGGKFIAKAVRRAYQLTDGHGTHYLDPYGDRQREYWQQFKDDMNAQPFSTSDRDAMISAASATFEAVRQMHRELYEGIHPATAHEPKSVSRCPFHHG